MMLGSFAALAGVVLAGALAAWVLARARVLRRATEALDAVALPAFDRAAPETRRARAHHLGTVIERAGVRYLGSGFGAHGAGEAVLSTAALTFRRGDGAGWDLPLAVVENAELTWAGAPDRDSPLVKVVWLRGEARLTTLLSVGGKLEAEQWRKELSLRGGLAKWPPFPLPIR